MLFISLLVQDVKPVIFVRRSTISTLRLRSVWGKITILIYIHNSKITYSAKKKLVLIVLKLWIMLLLILSCKLREQCILIGKNPKSSNRLNTFVLLFLYSPIALLLFFFLLIFFHLFFLYPFAIVKFCILTIYLFNI